MSLPQNLNYNNSVEAAASRSFRTSIQPQTGTSFKKSELIQFMIPTRNNLIMSPSESCFKGKVTFKNGAAASNFIRFDSCGAHGLINKIQIYHGSNLLETIENYNILAKMMFDLQVSTPQANGKQSILTGTSTEYASAVIAQIATADGTDLATTQALANSIKSNYNNLRNTSRYINVGRRLNPYGTQINANASVTLDFCFPLISLVGSLSPKYLPLFACKSAPLRLEITLVSNPLESVMVDVGLSTDGNDMIVSDVEFVCSMMELSDSAIDIIKSNTGGRPLQYTFGDWRNYRWSSAISNAVTNLSMPIPAKYASLKSILIASRQTSNLATFKYLPLSSEKLFLQNYNFRVGAEIVPSKSPSNVSEFFSEVLKAIGSISDPHHAPAIDYDSYNMDVQAQTTETLFSAPSIGSPSFYIALDCENYQGSDKSGLYAGKYTSNDDIFYNPILGASGGSYTAIFDAYANFDSVLVFENDTCYVKY